VTHVPHEIDYSPPFGCRSPNRQLQPGLLSLSRLNHLAAFSMDRTDSPTYTRLSTVGDPALTLPVASGHFEGERVVTPFTLLKCLRTHALWAALETIFRIKCTRLQDFVYTISKFFRGVISPPEIRNRPGVLGTRHQIPFGSRAFHCSCFTKGPLLLVLTQSMCLERTTTPRHVCTVHV